MSKFTFVCQEESMPFVHSIQSKRTVEFNAETLDDILNEFEMFLRGAGFHFEGRLDFVNEEEFLQPSEEQQISAWDWTVNELNKGPITLKDVVKEDDTLVFSNISDINLDVSNYGAAQPVWPFSTMAGEDTITLSANPTKCQVCGLDKVVMKVHNCYDDNCPKGTW